MIHMIEDMGVPAHANKVYHQGNVTEFDNFEFLALSNWKPNFQNINKQDPEFSEPWRYYDFSQGWTHADAPNYNSRSSFSKFWQTASASEKMLLSNRQGRISYVVMWALNSATKAFRKPNQASANPSNPFKTTIDLTKVDLNSNSMIMPSLVTDEKGRGRSVILYTS